MAVVLIMFGGLGLANGLPYFSTRGDTAIGMSSKGLLSTISLLTAAVLLLAAVRGGVREIVVGGCVLSMTVFGPVGSELPRLITEVYYAVLSLATTGALAVSVILVRTVDAVARDQLRYTDRIADAERHRSRSDHRLLPPGLRPRQRHLQPHRGKLQSRGAPTHRRLRRAGVQ